MSSPMEYPIDYAGDTIAAQAQADARAAFIRRTYAHLAGAILAFAGIDALLLNIPGLKEPILRLMVGSQMSWIVVMIGFMVVSWVATSWAMSDSSRGIQYMGLGLYVVAEAVIFLPLLYFAEIKSPGAIPQAAILTLGIFGGLSAAVLVTRKDFSALGPILTIGSFLALGLMIAGMIFGFNLGLVFMFFMVALACGYIIYQTSNIMHQFRTDQHVAAALCLFASVALLFWYILRIFMSSRD